MTAAPVFNSPTHALCGPEHGFLPNTPVPKTVMNYVYNDEGMGGYINYMAATTWLAKNCPWISGRVWCEQFLVPLAKDVHAPFKHWQVLPTNQFTQLVEVGTPCIGPMMGKAGMPAKREFLTALGTHPLDVGTGYYMSTCPAPADCLLPVLDYEKEKAHGDPKVRRALREPYVVFTAGGTTPIRTLTGEHLRPLVEFVKAKGMLPVFLGKKDILANGVATTKFIDDMDYSTGLDLRDRTTVKEAAAIMQHAQCTVGLDGGLLHLAALMRDSRVVFGYNITTVEHRKPRRNHGRTVNVALTPEELACTGCQSRWKGMHGHLYDKCFYDKGRAGFDEEHPERVNACLRLLFANNSQKFKTAIEEAIS